MRRRGASAPCPRSAGCRSSRSPPTPCPATRRRRARPAATAMSRNLSARASSWPRCANSCRDKREGFNAKVAKDAQRTRRVTEEQIGHTVIGAALKVHSTVGPGLLESAYEACLLYELEKKDLSVRRQVLIPVHYEDLTIDNGYRVDLLI